MPGIIVGIDGSDHSRHALEWAIREAAVRHAPLTVLTVQQAVAGYWGGPVLYPGDQDLAKKAREMAQEETDSDTREDRPRIPALVSHRPCRHRPARRGAP